MKTDIKKEDDLFVLIKSLTKTEKGYFKKYASMYEKKEGQKNYLRLFDTIEKQSRKHEKYNEEDIKKQFKKERFAKQLHVAKNYLYGLILKSLKAYQGRNDLGLKLKEDLACITVLYNKGLFGQANKRLRKLKKSAQQYEMYELLLEINKWEGILSYTNLGGRKVVEKTHAITREGKSSFERIKNNNEYRSLYFEVADTLYKKGYTRNIKDAKWLNLLMNNPLLKDKKNALSMEARVVFYLIHYLYNIYNSDFTKVYRIAREEYGEVSMNTYLLSKTPMLYLASLYRIISASVTVGRYEEALALIREMRTKIFRHSSIIVEAEVFTRSFISETDIYLKAKLFDKIAGIEPAIEKGLYMYRENIPTHRQMTIVINTATNFFWMGDLKKALHWINKLLNNPAYTMREDILSTARIINSIIHYEMNNIIVLDSLLRSIRYHIEKAKVSYKTGIVIIDHFKVLIKKELPAEQVEIFKQLENKLKALMHDPKEKWAFKEFDYLTWVKSKIQGRSYTEIAYGNSPAKKNIKNRL